MISAIMVIHHLIYWHLVTVSDLGWLQGYRHSTILWRCEVAMIVWVGLDMFLYLTFRTTNNPIQQTLNDLSVCYHLLCMNMSGKGDNVPC